MALQEELAAILNPKGVVTDPETLRGYSSDAGFTGPMMPGAVVRPGTVEEVLAIVNWANQTRTPLVPVSSGPPHGHGGTVPGAPGAVIVDLSGMKRIFKIDRRNRVAMVEAGVTYPELQPALAKEGLKASTPLLPRPNKSVVASLLEREPTFIPRLQWASLDPLRCTEVVWGDGKKLTTGDAGNWTSMEGAWERKQAAVGATGPGQVDFYRLVSGAQGSLGIVTWASVRCEVLPTVHKLFFVPAPQLGDLVDFTYEVLRYRYADEIFIMNNFCLAAALGGGPDRTRKLAAGLPPWMAMIGIAGRGILPEERVAYQQKDISDLAVRFGRQMAAEVPGVGGDDVLHMLADLSREGGWKNEYKGGAQDIFFMTTLNRTPDFAGTVFKAAGAAGYPAGEIGVYIQPQHHGASCHCEFIVPYDRNDTAASDAMQRFFTGVSRDIAGQGAYFSRPYGIWADLAYQRDEVSTRVLKKVKGIFDPNHIMNPGKLCFKES